MRIILVLTCCAAAALAQQRPFRPQPDRADFERYDQQAQQAQQAPAQQRNDFNAQPQRSEYQQSGGFSTTPIPIVRFEKEQTADGSYKTSYETGNNIVAEETGFLKNVGVKDEEALVQHGSYTYTGTDGVVYTVTYTADEQGFRPQGLHLPTPPPVPAEIQKSLDLIYEGIRQREEEEARKGPRPQQQQFNSDGFQGNQDNYPTSFPAQNQRGGFRQ